MREVEVGASFEGIEGHGAAVGFAAFESSRRSR
jgi:hypothetical protein